MIENEKLAELKDLGISFEENVALSTLSNTKTGGKVPVILYPKTEDELVAAINKVRDLDVKFEILGEMTNIAVASGDLDFVVINTLNLNNEPTFDSKAKIVTVPAGYKMKQLAVWALDHSIAGLQWMEGIPGTVGAGAYMNAGFLAGQDMATYLVDAKVLMPDGSVQVITNPQMEFSYRKSSIQQSGGIVLSARILVRIGKKWKIKLRMMQFHKRRGKNQPLDLPSAGTVFIPPFPYHVGGMLRQLKLTGHQIGGAAISTQSPGFIVGVDNMTGEDYYTLVKYIQQQVYQEFGVKLIPEVRLLGFSENLNE